MIIPRIPAWVGGAVMIILVPTPSPIPCVVVSGGGVIVVGRWFDSVLVYYTLEV